MLLNLIQSYKKVEFICCICGFKSHNIVSHINNEHKLTQQKYFEKFSNSKLNSLNEIRCIKQLIKKKKDEITLQHKENRRKHVEKQEKNKLLWNDKITCKICGFESTQNLVKHIVCKHSITIKDYKELYPNSCVCRNTKEQGKKQAESYKKRYSSDEDLRKRVLEGRSFPSELKHWIKKGYTEEEAKQKVSEWQSKNGIKQNLYPERKREKAKKQSGNNNPSSLVSIAKRNNVSLDEARKFTPCYGRIGEKHPMYGKKHTEAALIKIGNSINTSQKSKLEHELSDLLINHLNGGIKNAPVNGWSCDYVNHDLKIVVEFFGDFWHHNPKLYDEKWINPFTKRSSTLVWERDNRKLNELKEFGYKVFVVWEFDWKKQKNEILSELINAINNK